MGKVLSLSEKSRELIEAYQVFGGILPLSASSPIGADALVDCLSDQLIIPHEGVPKAKKAMEFTLAALRVALLDDLLISMRLETGIEETPTKTTHATFYLLVIAGTFFAVFEGIDNISTLFSVLALPQVVVLLIALAFSMVPVMVFYSLSLVEVSKNLGVKLADAPKLLDLYELRMDRIKCIRKEINAYELTDITTEELEHLNKTIAMLQKDLNFLGRSSQQFVTALNSSKIRMVKNLFAGAAGVLFFSSGFASGQSVALFLLSFINPSVTAAFWPVILCSIGIGLAAFSLYWYMEKTELQQLVGGWFGLDEKKIATLCKPMELEKQERKLTALKNRITGVIELRGQLAGLEQKCAAVDAKPNRQRRNSFFLLPDSEAQQSFDADVISPSM